MKHRWYGSFIRNNTNIDDRMNEDHKSDYAAIDRCANLESALAVQNLQNSDFTIFIHNIYIIETFLNR